MLDQLPPEITLKISSMLTLKNKLILITTCRHLFNFISKTNLYSELNLRRCNEKTKDIVGKFTGSRYPGSQVKKLIFDIRSISDELLFQLSTVFPNIISVNTGPSLRHKVIFQARHTQGPMLQWSNTLQRLDLLKEWPQVLPILKTTSFPRLTELTLSEPYAFDDKIVGFDTTYFLPVFKNVPSLKKLTLYKCALDLDLLEEIHANCPHLESVFIDYCQIIIKQHSLPSTIIPANSLLSLHIKYASCFDINGLLLEYITRKYCYLKQLHLQLEMEYHTRFFTVYYADVTQDFTPIYTSLVDEFKNTVAVYKESGSRFFSNLTTTIESITTVSKLFNNTIQIMANSSIEPVKLQLLGRLEDPFQILYIKYFKRLKWLELQCEIPEQIYSLNITCNSLTKLTIVIQSDTTYLDWFLTSFPSLEELYIAGGPGLRMTESNTTNQFSNLRKLTASVTFITQTCFEVLQLAAPNMKELYVLANTETGLDNVGIDISGWELRKLDLRRCHSYRPVTLFFKITTKNTTKVIKHDPREEYLAVMKNSAPFAGKKSGVVNIASTREEQFKFNGYSMSLSIDNVAIASEN